MTNPLVWVKTKTLTGAALDYAVAYATDAWKWAHRLYPTMTMDSTFCGIEPRLYPRGEFGSSLMTCVLLPNNAFRQDPQPFCPSISWEHAGPCIQKYWHEIDTVLIDDMGSAWPDFVNGDMLLPVFCRAIVSAKMGSEIGLPSELLQELQP